MKRFYETRYFLLKYLMENNNIQERISQAPNPNFLADSEVDAFMAQDLLRMTTPPDIGGKPALATPFERWKIEKVVYAKLIRNSLVSIISAFSSSSRRILPLQASPKINMLWMH